MLRGLALHGLDVQAIAARRSFAIDGPVFSDVPVEVVDVPDPMVDLRHQLRRLRYPRGSLMGPFLERVRDLARVADVVHLDEIETAWCNVGNHAPSSLNVHFRTLRDRRIPAPWRHEFRFLVEYAAAEVVAARRYRFLSANSREVAASLRRLNRRAEIAFAPFALEPSHYRCASYDGPPRAGIIGTASWPPTAYAIERLVGRVWPRMRRLIPEARLLVAGRGTELLPRVATEEAAIEYCGEVKAVSEFLAGVSVLLYPAVRGSGVKVKVIEAMACGVPVVTTACGAEGVAPNDGVVVCDDDAELARAAASILRDVGERRERGAVAHATFLRDHTPQRAIAPLVDLFHRMSEVSG